jgi:antibiotic biosynthesis monooxygenase (ABM) superfamily enzyme
MTILQNPARHSRTPRLVRRIVTTLLAWIGAYLVVNVVVLVGGRALATASPARQMLVISGTLVAVMVNVLMPLIAGVVARLSTRKPEA